MVKIEFFTATPPCPGCVALLGLADRISKEFPDLEVIKHIGPCDEFGRYGITYVPAVVVEEGAILFMGLCPSYDTLITALAEMGVKR
ncbi:MAG TPA: thioredoxin family protein [Candidatus Methanofastidiosa archaeon]|nr:thioredoxin family protein [Candidatus Methanofastidiosa archaeon]